MKSDPITLILTGFACFFVFYDCATTKKGGGMVQWIALKSTTVYVSLFKNNFSSFFFKNILSCKNWLGAGGGLVFKVGKIAGY